MIGRFAGIFEDRVGGSVVSMRARLALPARSLMMLLRLQPRLSNGRGGRVTPMLLLLMLLLLLLQSQLFLAPTLLVAMRFGSRTKFCKGNFY